MVRKRLFKHVVWNIVLLSTIVFSVSNMQGAAKGQILHTLPLPAANNFSPPIIKIMPLGDSITAGILSSDGGGYRTYLWQDLAQTGIPIGFVGSQTSGPPTINRAHEGHPGALIRNLIPHIVAWVTTYRPQIILLSIGTNDVASRLDRPHTSTQLSRLLSLIYHTSPTTVVIVAQITPLCRFDTYVQAYNRTIPNIVAAQVAQGAHMETVDMHQAVPMRDLKDCVHPNDDGYARMAQVWFPAIMTAIFNANIIPGAGFLAQNYR